MHNRNMEVGWLVFFCKSLSAKERVDTSLNVKDVLSEVMFCFCAVRQVNEFMVQSRRLKMLRSSQNQVPGCTVGDDRAEVTVWDGGYEQVLDISQSLVTGEGRASFNCESAMV